MKFFLQMSALAGLCALPFYLAAGSGSDYEFRVGDRFDECTVAKVLHNGVLIAPDQTPDMHLFVAEAEYGLLRKYGVEAARTTGSLEPGSVQEQIFRARQAMLRPRWATEAPTMPEG